MLRLQTMLLLPVMAINLTPPLRTRHRLLLLLLLRLQRLGIDLAQRLHREPDIGNQRVAPAPAEILADDDAHELELLRVRRHGVGGDDPAVLTQLVGDGEFVVGEVLGGVEAEGDEGEAGAGGLRHDDEAEVFEGFGEVVGCAGKVPGGDSSSVKCRCELGG